ncbi:hypothetical protein BU202_07625 [Streptococcus cuniculi]|uniref:Uncharacterized protein n=1 Tax=Streptococcus cuniculi TaxID=1432788 RepID=A0A1Q8E6U2_9STRE|nr:hypothetical protein [Streptococcus cuniculi]OLF47519.1 hypothetical protein BU202_07625 [Streptococcus cuniculi]
MKKELFYYWENFCRLNALLFALTALTLLLFPPLNPPLHFSNFANLFTFPLVVNRKMKTKLRYRFLIAIGLVFILGFILEPIWEKIPAKSLHPTPLFYFLASLVLGALALGNYVYQKRKKG